MWKMWSRNRWPAHHDGMAKTAKGKQEYARSHVEIPHHRRTRDNKDLPFTGQKNESQKYQESLPMCRPESSRRNTELEVGTNQNT